MARHRPANPPARRKKKSATPRKAASRKTAATKPSRRAAAKPAGKAGKKKTAAARRRSGRAERSSANGSANNARTRLITDERRAQLIALGLELFSSRPYDEVHIAELATAAGISKGLLYHYFPTKRDFYTAALRQAADRLLAQLQPDPELPPVQRLQRGLHHYLSYVQQYGTSYVALMRGGVGADPGIAAIVEETRVNCMSRLISGMGFSPQTLPPLVRIALRAWIGTVEAASLEWVLCPSVPAEEVVNLLSQQLLHLLLLLGAMPAM
ncbi:MAG: TetR/AcrR family transcriptional regulator [Myxococcales bacterium]|nr:TetR/AcrR family transcriptional regulator [Myxococcales bacterium]